METEVLSREVSREVQELPGMVRGTADPSAALGACGFFDLACSSWPESLEEHLPTGIAGVLRLRA